MLTLATTLLLALSASAPAANADNVFKTTPVTTPIVIAQNTPVSQNTPVAVNTPVPVNTPVGKITPSPLAPLTVTASAVLTPLAEKGIYSQKRTARSRKYRRVSAATPTPSPVPTAQVAKP